MFKFKINDEFRPCIHAQIVGEAKNKGAYDLGSQTEYETIKNFIRNKKKFLEVGCGLGRMSIYCNSQLDYKAEFILADSNGNPNKFKRYGWKPKDGYYNNLKLTEKFAKLNGLNNYKIFDMNKEDLLTLSGIDVVMSFFSVGFHYPIEDYMGKLLTITNDNCVMIFGLANGIHPECNYSQDRFKKYFKKSKIIENTSFAKIKPNSQKLYYLILEDKNSSNIVFEEKRDDHQSKNEKTISKFYHKYLQREPDFEGLNFYKNKIIEGCSLEWVERTIRLSDEAKNIQLKRDKSLLYF